jgi:GTP-binding protein
VPARGLIGIRTALMTETRGTAMMSHDLVGWEPWKGEIRGRANGSLISDRTGPATSYALMKLEDRGTFFISPGDDVYEGCIVGEHIRPEDLDVNIVREKHVTNHRSATSDELVRMAAPRKMTLDEAIEFISSDECVEVTPDALRLRKVLLTMVDRARERSKKAAGTVSV